MCRTAHPAARWRGYWSVRAWCAAPSRLNFTRAGIRAGRCRPANIFLITASSAHDVFWKLANGQVFEQPFTVREGETMFDIARDLEAAKFMPAAEFLRAAEDPALIRDLAPRATTLEGFLFPATYHLPRHPAATDPHRRDGQKI